MPCPREPVGCRGCEVWLGKASNGRSTERDGLCHCPTSLSCSQINILNCSAYGYSAFRWRRGMGGGWLIVSGAESFLPRNPYCADGDLPRNYLSNCPCLEWTPTRPIIVTESCRNRFIHVGSRLKTEKMAAEKERRNNHLLTTAFLIECNAPNLRSSSLSAPDTPSGNHYAESGHSQHGFTNA